MPEAAPVAGASARPLNPFSETHTQTYMRLPFLTSLAKGKITVLLFHKVPEVRHRLSPSEFDISGFEQVLDAVMENFSILPLAEALAAQGKGKLPSKTACITFDDGYPEWVREVAPALERRNAHATFFVTSGQFANLPMWNERILYAIDRCASDVLPLEMTELGLPLLPLHTLQERQTAVRLLDGVIKYLPPIRKEEAMQKLESHAGQKGGVPSMTAEELRHLHARGFAIGAHSISHPILTKCSDDEAYREIAESREMLEGIVGAPVKLFAYPNGIPGKDFGSEHVEMVRKAGYSAAFSTHSGVATRDTSRFQIPRFTPWGPSSAKMGLQLARNLMRKPALLGERSSLPGRALMVAFHFPPQAGSSGIHRTLNFVKHLSREGLQPAVLTANERAYEAVSEDLMRSIPDEVDVIRAFGVDASRHLSIRGKYLGLLALPDRWSSWWPGAVLAGRKHIREAKPEVIWSTYPIATAHLIGASLQRLSGLPWIADFRDPMVSEGFPVGGLQRSIWRWLEALVVRRATRCVFTTQRTAALYAARYPDHQSKFQVIENGYDEDAFTGNAPQQTGLRPGQMLWLHSGLIYPKERDPSTFFLAVRALIESGKISRESLKIRFRAARHESEIREAALRSGLEEVVETCPPIPYREAIAEMMGADLLLLFQGKEFDAQIPAKVYEYMRTGRPMLGLVGMDGDTASILQGKHNIALAPCDDSGKIVDAIEVICKLISNGIDEKASIKERDVYVYSREAGAVKLVSLIVDAN
jgi:peptidoglycan/xylan/chitin deacetylase (PgdA/CDA1 family)/glycosyltransferase involved in cell wall biosynthesis